MRHFLSFLLILGIGFPGSLGPPIGLRGFADTLVDPSVVDFAWLSRSLPRLSNKRYKECGDHARSRSRQSAHPAALWRSLRPQPDRAGLEERLLSVKEPAGRLEPAGLSEGMERFLNQVDAPRGVWPPRHWSTLLMLEAMERLKPIFQGAEVLDTGTGSGVLLLASLKKLGADRGVGTEPASYSLGVVQANAFRLGLSEKVEVRQGDLLDPVEGRQFKVALFNAWNRDLAEAYLMQVGPVLRPDGMALLLWNRHAEPTLRALAHQEGLSLEPVLQTPDGWRVYAITHSLTAGLEEPSGEMDEIGRIALRILFGRHLEKKRRAHWRGYQKQMARIHRQNQDPAGVVPSAAPSAPASSPEPNKPLGLKFDPAKWPDRVQEALGNLLRWGIARIPLEGGEAVLLLGEIHRDLSIDLLLKPTQETPVYIGRLDLAFSERLQLYVAGGGKSSPSSFSGAATRYLDQNGIPWSGERSPFQMARSEGLRWKALHVDPKGVGKLRVPQKWMEDALVGVAVELLEFFGQAKFIVDKRYDNPLLTELVSSRVSSVALNKDAISASIWDVRAGLKKRLMSASAVGSSTSSAESLGTGLEETRKRESAKERVLLAFSRLTRGRQLRWQVAGLSVASLYPALEVLDRYLSHFRIDPGGVGTDLLVFTLGTQRSPADRVTYYGTDLEHAGFISAAQRFRVEYGHRIDAGESPVAVETTSFLAFLQQLLANLTGTSPEELRHVATDVRVDLKRLAEDLEFLEKA